MLDLPFATRVVLAMGPWDAAIVPTLLAAAVLLAACLVLTFYLARAQRNVYMLDFSVFNPPKK